MSPTLSLCWIRALGVAWVVAAVEPLDEVERAQQAGVLAWLDSTPESAGGQPGWLTAAQVRA